MSKTIKEIADDLHITKPAVQQRINTINDFRKNHTSKIGNRLVVDDEGVLLIENYGKSDKQNQKKQKVKNDKKGKNDKQKTTPDVNQALIAQLEVKDEQIAKLQKMLDQQQQLQLATLTENRALKQQVDDLGGYLETTAVPPTNSESKAVKKSIWKRIFGLD